MTVINNDSPITVTQDGNDYTLTSPDGTLRHIDSVGGVFEEVRSNGRRLFIRDSGIVTDLGHSLRRERRPRR